ncbi:glycosyltransferase [Rhodoblastus acidophilus]|uniref:Glycosyltransferase n=1 Tax=Candidatus Rhodoblastus alkanivorans TaxID=2954117 RepID=A0ABS9Z2V7_9HYPH|nr:glycosyltransferase [Candidatus Rhodoblastus alkanivorans]MCI4680445.1 glycosyltransferase [Candidatus Rhodoblastus alkanivorans]MCI4681938.1 glycosyltransferase [Candidatus Rhodoblastus alkanivorans]MDI4642988.1 glycosyltransferase [Rhodoblastus acidophilus]
MSRIGLSIVICTFHRNDLLRALLKSVAAQELPDSLSVSVVVVDNSDEGLARAVVAEEAAKSPIPMRWIEAHPANISVARNAGVAAGDTDFVAFIDDDQCLEPGWLTGLSSALREQPFDAWLGRVIATFEKPDQAPRAARMVFSRELDRPASFELFAFGPKKIHGIGLATNNAVFRRATTLTEREPFDPALGVSGGEDYDLFCRLQRRGRRFAWLPGAVVSEFVPAERCQRTYLQRRFYAGGQHFARAVARGGAHPRAARWIIRAKAFVQAGLLAARAPLYLFQGADQRADFGFRLAGVMGKLSFGALYPLYQPKGK